MLFLLLTSLWDWKTREVPLWLMFGGTAAILSYGAWQGRLSLPDMLGGMLVGVFLLAAGSISKGQVGAGDGIVFVITGMSLGFQENFLLLAGSFFLSSLFCLGLLAIKKVGGKERIPFLPFTFAAYLAQVLLC